MPNSLDPLDIVGKVILFISNRRLGITNYGGVVEHPAFCVSYKPEPSIYLFIHGTSRGSRKERMVSKARKVSIQTGLIRDTCFIFDAVRQIHIKHLRAEFKARQPNLIDLDLPEQEMLMNYYNLYFNI